MRVWISAVLASAALASGYGLKAAAPAKGYVIAEISVRDPEAYKSYAAAVAPIVARFGGTYLVRGGETRSREGAPVAGRIVVIEFPSHAAAAAFYDSADYQAILPLRQGAADSRVFSVEGHAPTP
ncbi:MAG: DUF1330 domain-containing protein [Parvularculaceae bacterium]